MKIGILGARGIPNWHGGFEQFAERVSSALVDKGHEVFVYSSTLNSFKEKKWQGVNVIYCKDWEDKLGTAGQFIYDLNCIKNAGKQNFDILLHLGYTSDSIWRKRWPHNAINIVNMDGLEWKRSKYSRPVQWFLRRAESWAAQSADHLVADSTEIKKYLLHTYNRNSTYIPYGADIFTSPDLSLLKHFDLQPHQYYLSVSRLEPENNIETIIKGYLESQREEPLLIVGNPGNRYAGKLMKKYTGKGIRFPGGVYDKNILNNLRYFSKLHFHGHSVGGTNPSLLEAMACACCIVAHENVFNRVVLQNDAEYFASAKDVSNILNVNLSEETIDQRKQKNLEKIRSVYTWDKVISDYEQLMRELLRSRG
ncbi:MAG TPA: DUF1972 domain-containing protein [Chitinophagaceae bacterium]|nr:DUF1972 domain-containing protein [Chitinophagaceae bacterium]